MVFAAGEHLFRDLLSPSGGVQAALPGFIGIVENLVDPIVENDDLRT
jgi:hypothetical protein